MATKPPVNPVIRLDFLESLGLIVPWPTGVVYETQTGGNMCDQDRLEGFLVPLYDASQHPPRDYSDQLHKFFTGPKWGGECRYGIDAESAQVIDAILSPSPLGMSVDRSRLGDCREAWIYVTVKPEVGWAPHGLNWPDWAVLTWPNSD